MKQSLLFQPASLSVSEITRYLRQLFESDEILQDVWVTGEISNFSRPSSGHLYFTLKDSGAALRCVMCRSTATRLRLSMQDGMAVEVHGSIGIYEAGGNYQLYADLIRPAGEGALYQEFLRLKALLETEGLFDEERKRPIPERPQRIGIITSPTGAALQDMLNTLRRRYPLAEVIIAPTPVQGVEAPPALVSALERLNRVAHPDVILLARGGGSIEDLWAFNDERVVRAVAASTAPVITGVGHETDFTLADFAADLRAPTPTASAELATPNAADLHAEINDRRARLAQRMTLYLGDLRWRTREQKQHLLQFSPAQRIRSDRQRLDDLLRRGSLAVTHRLALERARLAGDSTRLNALSPLAVLERGYAVVSRSADGRLLQNAADTAVGEDVRIRLHRGSLDARVERTHSDDFKNEVES
ncbi:MAG: exodeoxyribonuclease VII large subunit [Anaerolineaceae bacterium]